MLVCQEWRWEVGSHVINNTGVVPRYWETWLNASTSNYLKTVSMMNQALIGHRYIAYWRTVRAIIKVVADYWNLNFQRKRGKSNFLMFDLIVAWLFPAPNSLPPPRPPPHPVQNCKSFLFLCLFNDFCCNQFLSMIFKCRREEASFTRSSATIILTMGEHWASLFRWMTWDWVKGLLSPWHMRNKSYGVQTSDVFWRSTRVLVSGSSFKWQSFMLLVLFWSYSAYFSDIQLVCDGLTDARTDPHIQMRGR